MDDLFSHAKIEPAATSLPDISNTVVVPTDTGHAFAGFTEHIHLWWPADELSVWGAGSFFDLEGNALVETSTDEDETVWAEILSSITGTSLALAWHHRPGAGAGTEVTVQFTDDDGGASVTLTHGGWTTASESEDVRRTYESFWPLALARYFRFMGGNA